MLDTIGGWIFAIALFWGLISLFNTVEKNRLEHVAKYATMHKCKHIGYAGFQNSNKMYKCDNGIMLDREMYL